MKKIVAVALLFIPAAGMADTSIGLRAGTLGAGIEVSHAFGPSFGLRVNVDAFNYSKSVDQGDISYDGKLKLKTGSLLADWYPFANNFRISAGPMYDGNKLGLTGKPTGGTYTINGVLYQASDVGSLNGQVDFKKTVPYAGIGYGRPIGTGLSLIFDLGIVFQGTPHTTLTATCGPAAPPGTPTCTQLQNDVAAQKATLDSKVKDLRYYPVLSLGLAYTF